MQVFFILVVTHFIADFMLQGNKLALNKKAANKYMLAHAAIISLAFFVPLINYPVGKVFAATFLVFITHMTIDALRVLLNNKLKADPSKYIFWSMQGIDQILHVSVIYMVLIYVLL